MSDNFLITGYHGKPHVTAENDRGINAAMFGTGRFVLPVGEQFRAEYIGNNIIRMYDGKLMDNGAAAGIPSGEHVDFVIANTGQGNNRNDLIVFQYEQDASTLVESGKFVIVQGTETMDTASDPALTQGDLLSDDTAFDQFALWRIPINSGAIAAPTQLFTVHTNVSAHVANQSNPHKVTKAQVGLGNVPNVATNDQTPTFTAASTLATLKSGEKLSVIMGKIMKAITDLINHIGNKSNPHGITAAQLNAVPTSRKVNSKALSADITLAASDVGAVPTARKVNGKALSADVTLEAKDVGALPTSGGTVDGNLYIGNETTTDFKGLYIRRVINTVLHSLRLGWNSETEGVRLQGASDGATFNYLELQKDRVVVNQPLHSPGVNLGSDTVTGERALTIKRLISDVVKKCSLYWNSSGALQLSASNGDEAAYNYIRFNSSNTALGKPLGISSGGHGETTAAAGLAALGGVSFTMLWENGSPTSSFDKQTVNITGLTNYDAIIVNFKQSAGSSYRLDSYFIRRSMLGGKTILITQADYGTGQKVITERQMEVTFSAGTVEFQAATNDGTSTTAKVIPFEIIGVKNIQGDD